MPERMLRAAYSDILEAGEEEVKEREQRRVIAILCTDMLVRKEYLLRKIDAAVDFARNYELEEDLYSEDNGRPSCDPVIPFKLVLIWHLFGIRSLRQIRRNVEVNMQTVD